MKIKLLTSLSGADGAFSSGDEYECSVDEAQRHVDAGNAEYIRTAKVEKAVKRGKTEKAAR